MIIGINGKIGSGKDTVGRMIQYLTSEYRDKYSFVEWRDRVENYNSNTYSPWEIKKFAGKLKQTASLLTGIPVEKFEDQEFKKTSLGSEWNRLLYATLDDKNPLLSVMSVREFLQKLGTEAMRDGLHTNVWVNALFADYKPKPNKAVAEFLAAEGLPQSMNAGETEIPNWIITDMRFPNEMEAVIDKDGITIRVVRNQIRTGNLILEHPSETALDGHTMHYEIINDGTIEDLVEKVREVLIKENII